MEEQRYTIRANGAAVESHATYEAAIENAAFVMDAPGISRVFVYNPDGWAVWANGYELDAHGNPAG